MITLNCATPVELTRAFLPAMHARRAGAIINVASLAGFRPMPYTEAPWAESRERGLRCLAVCPGPVDTPFFEAAGGSHLRQAVPPAMMARPVDVVAHSLRALDAGCTTVVPGLANRLVARLPRLLPRRWLAASTERVMRRHRRTLISRRNRDVARFSQRSSPVLPSEIISRYTLCDSLVHCTKLARSDL